MTNETTASQPKSIGDDAQFVALLDWCLEAHISGVSLNDRERFDAGIEEMIAYVDQLLDSRTPAAQAAATIQAAPDSISAKVRAIAEKWNSTAIKEGFAGNEVAYELLAALGDFDDSATIQEPVMVADPVGQARQALIDLRELHISTLRTPTHFNAYLDIIDKALNPAAPMVADPAGVATWQDRIQAAHPRSEAAHWPDDLKVKYMGDEIEAYRRATTVKAVPSEALEADAILESAAKIADAEMIPTNILSDQWDHGYFAGAGTVAALIRASKSSKIVAPLADNTGGGE